MTRKSLIDTTARLAKTLSDAGATISVRMAPTISDAETCRKNGWMAGTRLVGDEGHGPTVIEITAVGERSILAKRISHNGIPEEFQHEGNWTLSCRDWKVVEVPTEVPTQVKSAAGTALSD